MTISESIRKAAVKRVLVRLAEKFWDAPMGSSFGDADLDGTSPLGTTLDELEDRGWIELVSFRGDPQPYALTYDNALTREIRQVTLAAASRGIRVSVSFSSRRHSLIDFSITADDDGLVVSLRQDILELLDDVSPWYDPIATVDFRPSLLLVSFSPLERCSSRWHSSRRNGNSSA
jgi:hypothetical protein